MVLKKNLTEAEFVNKSLNSSTYICNCDYFLSMRVEVKKIEDKPREK
jgi:hypothetical protein